MYRWVDWLIYILIDWRWSVLMASHASSLWFCYAKSLPCSDKITENHLALKTTLTTWMIKGIVNPYAVSNPYDLFCGTQQVNFWRILLTLFFHIIKEWFSTACYNHLWEFMALYFSPLRHCCYTAFSITFLGSCTSNHLFLAKYFHYYTFLFVTTTYVLYNKAYIYYLVSITSL